MLVRCVQQWACVRVWSSLLLCHFLVPTCVYYQSVTGGPNVRDDCAKCLRRLCRVTMHTVCLDVSLTDLSWDVCVRPHVCAWENRDPHDYA